MFVSLIQVLATWSERRFYDAQAKLFHKTLSIYGGCESNLPPCLSVELRELTLWVPQLTWSGPSLESSNWITLWIKNSTAPTEAPSDTTAYQFHRATLDATVPFPNSSGQWECCFLYDMRFSSMTSHKLTWKSIRFWSLKLERTLYRS